MEEVKDIEDQRVYLISIEIENLSIKKAITLELRSFPAWAKVMKDVWLVKSHLSASEIRDKLKIPMHSGDKVFVMRASKGWAYRGVTVGEWIRRNI